MKNSVFCEHRMVGNDFNPASVIWCHNSIGAVAYVRRRVATVKNVLSVAKTHRRILLATDEYPKYIENHPLVFDSKKYLIVSAMPTEA
jgi:DUF1365 family protein